MPLIVSCKTCGKPVLRSRPDANNINYCSIRCRWSGKVNRVDSKTGCWTWIGTTAKSGYGVMRIDAKVVTAHRISYALHKGDPTGFHVLHSCDNRLCVNPDHLRLGDDADNNKDAMDRGRHAWYRWSDMEKESWLKKMMDGQKRKRLLEPCV